jgi:hypothetical protein
MVPGTMMREVSIETLMSVFRRSRNHMTILLLSIIGGLLLQGRDRLKYEIPLDGQ